MAKRWLVVGGFGLLGTMVIAACGGSDSDDASPAGTGSGGAAAGAAGAAGTGGAAAGTAGTGGGGTAGNGGGTAGTGGSTAGAGGGGAGGPPQELVDACKAYHTANCMKMGQCAPPVLELNGGQDGCVEALSKVCMQIGGPGQSVGPKEVSACIPKIAALSCDDYVRFWFGGELNVCGYGPGTRAAGEPCAGPLQCQGQACTAPSIFECGVCASVGKLGDSCSATAPCEIGLFCGSGKLCTAFAKEGEACSASTLCQANLLCTSGKCGPKHKIGDDCNPQQNGLNGCGVGNHCNLTTKKCEAFSVEAAGAACGFTPTGGWAVCKPPSACKITDPMANTGMCVPQVPKGGDCSGAWTTQPCEAGALCDGKTCKAPAGASCG